MIRTTHALLAAVAAAALAVGSFAGGADAAPKKGFRPGTWIATGTIAGTGPATEGPTPTFEGRLAFTLVVGRDGRVKGTGVWSRTMTTLSPGVSALVSAKARVQVVGTATAPRLVGSYRATGTFAGHGVSRTTTFAPMRLDEPLVITRAGHCRVTGTRTFQGVTTTWTARLTGSGTCRT